MHEDDRLSCVLCRRSEETKITGALATKDDVTAHQNCLLFSSALFCRNTPKFDDLFGFSVDDVLNEEKRGRLLICHKCKRRGATAGCEVGRCKKSYHYPCAVEERAMIVEDSEKEQYRLFCYNHYPKTKENNHSGNGCLSSSSKSKTYRNPEEPGTSKKETSARKVCLVELSCHIVTNMLLVHTRGMPVVILLQTKASVYSSDLNSSSSRTLSSSKRRLTFKDKQDWTPSKRRAKVLSALLTDDSSNSDGDDEPDSEMAPLETDVEDSAMVHEPDVSLILIVTQ
ncbi:hypothetical protein PBY51_022304 [Eleginops maclovinus]|uniref:PHD-type domain-containing protein n=1 Tax=Eleginops maclovinus TaxID=56733 RepID=A0AAN7XGR9_ELEMC|nr:hypothetical protein PBY51_022304 [Eleginops maclovinus]